MLKNTLITTGGIALLLISNLQGHVNPPFSISFTPVLIGLFTGLILFSTDFRIPIKFGLITIMIILNDILIKLYAGGTHDWEGLGFISGFLFLGLILSIILIIVYLFTKQKNRKLECLLYLFISCLVIWIYLIHFQTLGMTWINEPSKSLFVSKEKGRFLSNIKLNDSIIVNNIDTFTITGGWIEKQTRTSHFGLNEKIQVTNKNNCILLLKGNFANNNEDINFKLDNEHNVGYQQIDTTICLIIDNNLKEFGINFYALKQRNWPKIKTIIINTGK